MFGFFHCGFDHARQFVRIDLLWRDDFIVEKNSGRCFYANDRAALLIVLDLLLNVAAVHVLSEAAQIELKHSGVGVEERARVSRFAPNRLTRARSSTPTPECFNSIWAASERTWTAATFNNKSRTISSAARSLA